MSDNEYADFDMVFQTTDAEDPRDALRRCMDVLARALEERDFWRRRAEDYLKVIHARDIADGETPTEE